MIAIFVLGCLSPTTHALTFVRDSGCYLIRAEYGAHPMQKNSLTLNPWSRSEEQLLIENFPKTAAKGWKPGTKISFVARIRHQGWISKTPIQFVRLIGVGEGKGTEIRWLAGLEDEGCRYA